MALPQLTAADVEAIVPNCKVVAPSLGGGQKIVYPCCIDGHRCAVKFILLGELKDDLDGDVQSKMQNGPMKLAACIIGMLSILF